MVQIYKPPRKARSRKPNKVTVTIDDIDHLGQGVCRSHKPVLFVQGALPEEQVEVDVREQKAKFWQGIATKIIKPAKVRTQPFCAHFNQCGGCQTQHVQPAIMREYKRRGLDRSLSRALHVSSINWQQAIAANSSGYRRKCRLAIDARDKQDVRIGFRGQHSSKVIDIQSCGVLVPELAGLIAPLNQLVKALSNPRAIGHIGLLRGDNTTQITLRLTKSLGNNDQTSVKAFAKAHGCQLVLASTQGDDEVFGAVEPGIDISINQEMSLKVQSDDFIQVNHQINLRMIEQAIDWLALTTNDKVVDLFSGLGNFSLPMASRCASVLGVEGVAKMVQRAEQNALRNGILNCQFVSGDLTEAGILQRLGAEIGSKVLLDPSREGAADVIPQICALAPTHVLYVSCNPATFVRDAKILTAYNYRLEKIALMDMFPNTTHTELMALFVPLGD